MTTPLFKTTAHAKSWLESALSNAVSDIRDAWHSGGLTYFSDGCVSKTVIWRHFDQASATLSFYTDSRSSKWAAFRTSDDRAAILLYCPKRLIQLSIQGQAITESGTKRTKSLYSSLTPKQQLDYQSRAAPGEPQTAEFWPGPKEIDTAQSDKFFGLVSVKFDAFDFISLHRSGHQRLSGKHFSDLRSWTWRIP